ncbi:FMRFamide receptor [Hydra vulgaris]|uniref:FMRFamide receptor n=1 Tax=Hydra vulgaris TaxID=6087 RepID=UPI001F5FBF6C|nr:FMRFamide receptor-like [Hydra vulgaris]
MASAQTLQWIFCVPVGLAVSICGLIGNFLSIFVWRRINNTKLRQSQSTGIYFIALALCDNGLIIFFVLKHSLMTLFPSLQDESYIYATFYCYFGSPFYSIFLIASAWLTVAVTLNRFLMIILPLKARSLCSPNRIYWSIFGLIIFSLVINIPQFLIFKTIRVDETKVVIVTTTFGSSKNFELWLHCIFALLTPWILIAVLNTIVVYYLSVQRKELERINDDIKYGKDMYLLFKKLFKKNGNTIISRKDIFIWRGD